MEGGQAHSHTQPPAVRWLHFAQWLQQQRGGPPEEAVSEASTSDVEEADLPVDPAALAAAAPHAAAAATTSTTTTSSTTTSRGGAAAAMRTAAAAGGGPPAPVTPSQLARHATLAPRLPDCRAETRLTSDSCSRARQETTVMLAAPGMPLHHAPVLTAKQASALMAAICEPLLSLPVGRLTRKLSAPAKLQPTEDRGVLSLWLLPDDSLSLVWQSAQQLAPEALEGITASAAGAATAAAAPAPPSSSGSSSSSGSDGGSAASTANDSSSSSSVGGGEAAAQQPPPGPLPGLQQSCSVAVWEELAHFPAMAHLLDDAPVVTIHMLRGDVSGRSFYIRVRNDVAEANLEAATAAVPDARRLLQQQRAAATAAAAPGSAAALAAASAADTEQAGAPRMYFWLTERDLGRAVYSLGRLKSLLKRPPTLSKRSGVPERQLQQLGAWVHRAGQVAAEQQRQAAAATTLPAAAHRGDAPWQEPAASEQHLPQGALSSALPAGAAAAAAAAVTASSAAASNGHQLLQSAQASSSGSSSGLHAASDTLHCPASLPLLHSANPGLLLGQPGMAAAAQMQGSMAALLQPSPPPLPPIHPPSAAAGAEALAASGSGSSVGTGSAAEGTSSGGSSSSSSPSVPAACGTSTVSATAAALYQDHRFNVVCPCTISVVVGMKVQAVGVDPALLPAEASARARAVAERQAKAAVDRSGRQRIEERLAEAVLRNIRTQRSRARQARQAQRAVASRVAAAERALQLARQATGRAALGANAGIGAGVGALDATAAQAQALAASGWEHAGAAEPVLGRSASTPHNPSTLSTPLHVRQPSEGFDAAASGRASGTPRALGSPARPITSSGTGASLSPPPAPPVPASMLSRGRVTLGDLHSLLGPQHLEGSVSGPTSAASELGAASPAAGTAAAADGRNGGTASSSASRLSVADLADLLNKHKLE